MEFSVINPSWKDFYLEGRKWYHESYNNSKNLLITVGDSWTWGQMLGEIDPSNGILDNYEHRIQHVYGYHLSNLLDTDWVNVGICGASNLNLALITKDFLSGITKQYNKIFIVFNLTEIGRELVSDISNRKEKYNDIAGADWPKFKDVINGANIDDILEECLKLDLEFALQIKLHNIIKNANSPKDLINNYEEFTISTITRLLPQAMIFSNFTRFKDINQNWVDVIQKQGNIAVPYPNDVKFLYFGVDRFLEFANKFSKDLLTEIIETTNNAREWFSSSIYNSAVSCHPLEQAHLWWANYLYEHIKKDMAV
jgi:hypothetical protein